ncbi:MAG: putative dipeptidyl peptidase [Gemmatimonadetes bacterium]|nr:putative dipeptidyl peptidase [Gemmatimonadota bacterium]
MTTPTSARRLRWTLAAQLAAGFVLAIPALAQQTVPQPESRVHANWTLANRYSNTALRNVIFGTAVQPRWIGKTDSMFYNWKSKAGSQFTLVVPMTTTKRPLFDHEKLAVALTMTTHKPIEATNLPFTTINFTKDHKAIRFAVDSARYEWILASETLKSLGKVLRDSIPQDEEREVGGGGGGGGFGGQNDDFRNWSPDSTAFVFARNHNLFIVENVKPNSNLKGDTTQISTDGVKDYTFGFRDTAQVQLDEQQQQEQQQLDGTQGGGAQRRSRDPRVRPQAVWSPDSKAFAISRNDARKVKELYLVSSLAEPRPTLMSYRYAMPGEESVPQQELWAFKRGTPKVTPVATKRWKDQRLMNIHFNVGSDKVRMVRRDRLQRNLDLIEVDIATGAMKTLLSESLENAALEPQNLRYTKAGGDIIWWSERSGWGQYYLYGNDGTYKRALTQGSWHAENISAIDSVKGVIWLTGEGREDGENPYLRHLYRVNADGTGFSLVDPGNFNHNTTVTPTKRYIVDSYSRVDYPTKNVVRDASGKVVMNLEEADVSRLKEMGWRMPEAFVVKAADGVTDIYCVMWKPFDFDSTRKYPIVANVYPGPQTESVNTTFVAGGVPQQLAQLGFIVIQIGNRGGSPLRSLAYHRYGYYNLRDYALADKKSGIEQLAARHKFIDIDKVGIYGHSGGGFLTAAALMLPPYNDFFKVGVSSSGNHDNNIYNQNWSENNHGLKVVPVKKDTSRVRGTRGIANANAAAPGDAGVVAQQGSAPGVARDTVLMADSTFEIHVPTNIELAPNLKGRLLLTTGDMDNNVHPGNTVRLVNALIKANKRFDYMVLPGKPHAYGDMQPYFTKLLMEYFAENLIGDYYRSDANIR